METREPKNIAEPMKEMPCLKCKGTGRVLHDAEYEDGIEVMPPQPGPCPRCKGKGVIKVEIKR